MQLALEVEIHRKLESDRLALIERLLRPSPIMEPPKIVSIKNPKTTDITTPEPTKLPEATATAAKPTDTKPQDPVVEIAPTKDASPRRSPTTSAASSPWPSLPAR